MKVEKVFGGGSSIERSVRVIVEAEVEMVKRCGGPTKAWTLTGCSVRSGSSDKPSTAAQLLQRLMDRAALPRRVKVVEDRRVGVAKEG